MAAFGTATIWMRGEVMHFEVLVEDASGKIALAHIIEKILGPNGQVLNNYVQDSICGTWEKLADAVYPGGSQKLKQLGWPHTGKAKCEWAEKISPYINVDTNHSKSFQVFRHGIRHLAGMI